jgi:hypothetical protein
MLFTGLLDGLKKGTVFDNVQRNMKGSYLFGGSYQHNNRCNNTNSEKNHAKVMTADRGLKQRCKKRLSWWFIVVYIQHSVQSAMTWYYALLNEHRSLLYENPDVLYLYFIQSAPEGKVNILGDYSIGHSKKKVYMNMYPIPNGFRYLVHSILNLARNISFPPTIMR